MLGVPMTHWIILKIRFFGITLFFSFSLLVKTLCLKGHDMKKVSNVFRTYQMMVMSIFHLMSWRINTIYIAIFLEYYSLINAIPNIWKRSVKRVEDIDVLLKEIFLVKSAPEEKFAINSSSLLRQIFQNAQMWK